MVALAPHEFPKLYEADLFHLHARVGLDAPQKVRAAPRSQVMAASGVPEKAQDVADVLQGDAGAQYAKSTV